MKVSNFALRLHGFLKKNLEIQGPTEKPEETFRNVALISKWNYKKLRMTRKSAGFWFYQLKRTVNFSINNFLSAQFS